MLNSLSKILPGLSPLLPELPQETKAIDEGTVAQWQARFKQCGERLQTIQNQCAGHATYWSAFFENQAGLTKLFEVSSQNASSEAIYEFESALQEVKASTNKKLQTFEKKIQSRTKDMKSYLDSMERLVAKRKAKKVEIEKHDYYFRLYENKESSLKTDENALALTSKERLEYEKLKTQLARCKKQQLAIETQMSENFPTAYSMYCEFEANIQDVIVYDLQEIADDVSRELTSFEAAHPDFIHTYPQVHESWSFDLVQIRRQTGRAGNSAPPSGSGSAHHQGGYLLQNASAESVRLARRGLGIHILRYDDSSLVLLVLLQEELPQALPMRLKRSSMISVRRTRPRADERWITEVPITTSFDRCALFKKAAVRRTLQAARLFVEQSAACCIKERRWDYEGMRSRESTGTLGKAWLERAGEGEWRNAREDWIGDTYGCLGVRQGEGVEVVEKKQLDQRILGRTKDGRVGEIPVSILL